MLVWITHEAGLKYKEKQKKPKLILCQIKVRLEFPKLHWY